jgi:hypothetical protein
MKHDMIDGSMDGFGRLLIFLLLFVDIQVHSITRSFFPHSVGFVLCCDLCW